MGRAAELGALARVGPGLGDRERQLVRWSGVAEVDHVALDEEVRDVEGVVHVERVQDETHRLVHRQREHGRLIGRAGGLGAVLVAELPLPLEAGDLDGRRVGDVRAGLHLAQREHAEEEEDEDDDGRDDRPDDLDGVVAVELLRQDVVAGLAPVANDGVEDEALDADEDDRREAEDDQVEIEDVLAGVGLRRRRQETAGEQDHEHERRQPAGDRSQPGPGRRGVHRLDLECSSGQLRRRGVGLARQAARTGGLTGDTAAL